MIDEEILDIDRAIEIYSNCPTRRTEIGGHPELLYKDKWLRVGKTDLIDDLCVFMLSTINPLYNGNPIEYYRNRIKYGIRIYESGLFVISDYSDDL